MRTISQLLLTFLLNACWQVALVAAFASCSSWLLRHSAARYRHWIWVAALLLSLGIPATTAWKFLTETLVQPEIAQSPNRFSSEIPPLILTDTKATETFLREEGFMLSRPVALGLLAFYLIIVLFSSIRLLDAWYLTKRLRLSGVEFGEDERISGLMEKCAISISGMPESPGVRFSEATPVPVTIGTFKPVVILPWELLGETNDEVLTSAIGHEFIHVKRRDYALNLFYELLYLPLSFHPFASLIRRRIRQTRELSCDELVAERILKPEVYARSLVKLASSAPTLHRLSATTTVGIADADILEARIMALLKKPKRDTRRKRTMLIGISLLLLVPCLAAASFAMKFDLLPPEPEMAAQEPSQQEKERQEREIGIAKKRMSEEEFKERMANDPKFREEIERKRDFEMKMQAVRQAALVRLARITMDQAIQIATSQQPGKVLQCSLDAEHWEEPGKLAKDGFVFYHVVIVPEDEEEGVSTHVLVNAVDGTIIHQKKELPRKLMRSQ